MDDFKPVDLFEKYAAVIRLGRELIEEGPQGADLWRRACSAVDLAPHALTIAPQSGRFADSEDLDAPIAHVRTLRRVRRY